MPIMSNRDISINRIGYWESSSATSSASGTTPSGRLFRDLFTCSTTNSPRPINYSKVNPHTFDKLLTINSAKTLSYTNKQVGFPRSSYRSTSYGDTPFITDGGWPNPYSTSWAIPPQWSQTDGRALEKILEKVRGSHASLSVDFAEGRQTIQMLKQALNLRKTIFEFGRDVVRQRKYRKIRPGPTQGQRRLDYVNGKWLEYRYGWMPLVSSLYDTVDALRKERVSGPTPIKARSGATFQKKYLDVRSGNLGKMNTSLQIDLTHRTEYSCTFALQSGYTFSDFTSLNPATIAWELTPFSFIVDWFVGVGQCLENWENYYLYRNSFITGYRTRSAKEDRLVKRFENAFRSPTYNFDGSESSFGYMSWNEYQQSEVFSRWKSRILLTSLPTPSGPRVKANLKPKQFMDIAALVSGYCKQFR